MAGYSSVRARTASSGHSPIAVSYKKYRSTNESMYGMLCLTLCYVNMAQDSSSCDILSVQHKTCLALSFYLHV